MAPLSVPSRPFWMSSGNQTRVPTLGRGQGAGPTGALQGGVQPPAQSGRAHLVLGPKSGTFWVCFFLSLFIL